MVHHVYSSWYVDDQMKYVKLFVEAFSESFAREVGIQFAYLIVWAWRGAYFTMGVLLVLWLLGYNR